MYIPKSWCCLVCHLNISLGSLFFKRHYFQHLNKALPISAIGLRGMGSACVSTPGKVKDVVVVVLVFY